MIVVHKARVKSSVSAIQILGKPPARSGGGRTGINEEITFIIE
jgi:hypothetical protein